MTSVRPDLYDANVPSDGLTIDTTDGPVDMVAVLARLNGEKGHRLTGAERAVVAAVKARYRDLRPTGGHSKRDRAEVIRRLARTLTDAA